MSFRLMVLVSGIGLIAAQGFISVYAMAQAPAITSAIVGDADQKAKEISTEQMRQILSDGSALIVDSRPSKEFANGHIPGALNPAVPPEQTVAAVEKLARGDKSKAIILYCNGPFCEASRRLSAQLLEAGFNDVRRYQLGMPVWRALGGPTAIELTGVERVFANDKTAVFLDARPAGDFNKGSISGAMNLTPEAAAKVKGSPMPLDDFNTRIILFGADAAQARSLADALSKRPWHNVAYFNGTFNELNETLKPH